MSVAYPFHAAAQTRLALPDFGDPSQQYLSAHEERRIGQAMLQNLRNRGFIIDDVQINEYLSSVGQRIAAYAENNGNSYTFFPVQQAAINAFATPGGFIGVNSGLLLATQSEDELAGVLAHEVAHVSQRHIARAYADQSNTSIRMAAALLASALVAAASPQAGQAALAGTIAAGAQHQINFTRGNEQEADRVGSQILSRSGYDVNGMPMFFARLERLSGGYGSNIPEFLRTHPLPESRIADTQNRFSNSMIRKDTRRDPLPYYLAKARTEALTSDNVAAVIRRFEITLAKGGYQNETAERYGYAVALSRAGRYREAQQQIEQLRKNDPDRLAFRLEEAEIALAMGDRDRAWRLFDDLARLYPDDYTVAVHYGRALALQGDPRKAMQLLDPHLRRRGGDAPLYMLYAQAAQRAHDNATSHATMAEYYFLTGELQLAIGQAELALRSPGISPYQEAQVRARLRQLRDEEAAERRR